MVASLHFILSLPFHNLDSIFTPNLVNSIPSVPGPRGAKADESDRRDKRARRFVHENGSGSATPDGGNNYQSNERMGTPGRISQGGSRVNVYGPTTTGLSTPEPEGVYDPNVIEWDQQTIVGTSSKLEKPFLRLTSVNCDSPSSSIALD